MGSTRPSARLLRNGMADILGLDYVQIIQVKILKEKIRSGGGFAAPFHAESCISDYMFLMFLFRSIHMLDLSHDESHSTLAGRKTSRRNASPFPVLKQREDEFKFMSLLTRTN